MKNLDELIAQHEARLRDLKAQLKRHERKADTRRKILIGAAYLAMLEGLPEDQRRKSLARVHEAVTNPKDRAFLGLPATPTPPTPRDSKTCALQLRAEGEGRVSSSALQGELPIMS